MLTFFLCGDVMTGRGIDQILPVPGDPVLYESYVRDARDYVRLAERRSGPIPRDADDSYMWGMAIEEFATRLPDVKIVNLETAVTTSQTYWPGKGIHYRMHPDNVTCLKAAGIDCCTLANNHVLDWGYPGLAETLQTLERTHLHVAGAGRSQDAACRPFQQEIAGKGRVIVLALGSPSSGIPKEWAATESAPGVFLLDETQADAVNKVRNLVQTYRQPGTVIVASIHWGGNWGYAVPSAQQKFAHSLISSAGVDVVFGHSSHHFKGLEVFRHKPIIYGAGDLLTDYEGIDSHRTYRGELGFMYFLTMDPVTSELRQLELVPTEVKRFQLTRPEPEDVDWMVAVLNREGRAFNTSVVRNGDHHLQLQWT